MVHPDDTAKTFAYDAYGNLVAVTDPAGGTTQYLFGESEASPLPNSKIVNRQSSIVPPAATAAAARRLTGIISPVGRRTVFTHDALGRRIAQTVAQGTPEADTSRTDYDAVGNVIKTITPTDQVTTHPYDSRNRRVATTDALNRTWKFVHATSTGASGPASCCGGGNPGSNAPALETHNPDGTIEAQNRDAAGQLVETKDVLGHSVKYGYDPDGRLESLTDENGNLTRWTYDPRGKLSAKIYADGSSERYQHNAAGELIRRTRPDDSSVAYTYNVRSRLLSALWDQDKAPASHFTYDAAGRMTQAKNINSTIDRAYDPVGRLATETQTLAHANNTAFEVGYAYDPDGKLTVLTYPDKSAVRYAWNQRGDLSEVSSLQPKASSLQPVASYARRLDGLVERLTHGNGVVTTKTYDAVGRIVTIAHIAPDGTVLDGETSRYDAMNRRTARIRPDGTADLFDYDPTGQVIGGKYDVPVLDGDPSGDPARVQEFVYDPAGNRKEFREGDARTTYEANELNQYSTIQLPESRIDEPQFDKSGNLLRDKSRSYDWDADSHLLGVTTTDGTKTRYAYDALHRRVWREDAEASIVFVHDAWNVIAEYSPPTAADNASFQTAARIWGEDLSRTLQGAGGIGAHLASIQPETKQQESRIPIFFHYDGNGNVILLTGSEGVTAATYCYDGFGRTTKAEGSKATSNRYRFSTKPEEACGDAYFYGYRYYNAAVGRWINRDPLVDHLLSLPNEPRVYLFVSNSPLSSLDFLGLCETAGECTPGNVTMGIASVPRKAFSPSLNLAGRHLLRESAQEILETIATEATKNLTGVLGLIEKIGLPSVSTSVQVQILGAYWCCCGEPSNSAWNGPHYYNEEVERYEQFMFALPGDYPVAVQAIQADMNYAKSEIDRKCKQICGS